MRPDTAGHWASHLLGTEFSISNLLGEPEVVSRSQQFHEFTHPSRVSRPGGGSHQVAINMGGVHSGCGFNVAAAAGSHFGADRRVAGTSTVLQDTGCSQDLRSVADSGDGFFGLCKVPNHREDLCIESKIFRGSASRYHESIELVRIESCKICIDREAMSGFFGVGLVTFKVVNRRGNGFPSRLIRTNGRNKQTHSDEPSGPRHTVH